MTGVRASFVTRSSVHGSSEKYLLGVADFSRARERGGIHFDRNGSINNADTVEWRGGSGEERCEREIEFRVVGEQSPSVG